MLHDKNIHAHSHTFFIVTAYDIQPFSSFTMNQNSYLLSFSHMHTIETPTPKAHSLNLAMKIFLKKEKKKKKVEELLQNTTSASI